MKKITRALEKSLLFTQRYRTDEQTMKEIFERNKDNIQFFKNLQNMVERLYNETIKTKETEKK